MDIFQKNRDFLTPGQMERLASVKAAVVGVGALGQLAAHELARSGIGGLILIDPDRMEASNRNRQIYASESTEGRLKAEALAEGLKDIHPGLDLKTAAEFLRADNAVRLLDGADMILDCVDDIPTKLLLEKIAGKLGVPLIHGAVNGWCGQVAVIHPEEPVLGRLYSTEKRQKETALMATVGVIASLQANEAVKLGIGKKSQEDGQILFVDLLNGDFSYILLK